MTQQEQFEADYLAAFPYRDDLLERHHDGRYICRDIAEAYDVWLQQAKRHEGEQCGRKKINRAALAALSIDQIDEMLDAYEAETQEAVDKVRKLEAELRAKAEVRAVLPMWVVAREVAVDVLGKKELGYALLENMPAVRTFDEASAAIAELGLPLGWVAIELHRLVPMAALFTTPPAQAVSVPEGWRVVPAAASVDWVKNMRKISIYTNNACETIIGIVLAAAPSPEPPC